MELRSATWRLDEWEDLLERYDADSDALELLDWDRLLALVDDPALRGWAQAIDLADEVADGQAAVNPSVRTQIETSLTAQCGSVIAAIEQQVTTASRQATRARDALDALQDPMSEQDRAALVAYQLVSEGFFDRLARPRSSIHRSMAQAWDQFTGCQDLEPEPDAPAESGAPRPPSDMAPGAAENTAHAVPVPGVHGGGRPPQGHDDN